MTKTKSVYVEGLCTLTEEMFREFGWEVAFTPIGADLICFTGGADVSPMLYEMPKDKSTQNNLKRDEECCDIYYTFGGYTPMVGICRGGQFLNVMCGGELYQDIDNHNQHHDAVNTETGQIYEVTSDHHQMMIPHESGDILLIADLAVKKHPSEGYYNNLPEKDVEVVMYEDDKCLCFQPHPEWVPSDHECCKLFFELIDELMEDY